MIHLTFYGRDDRGALGAPVGYETLTPTTDYAQVAPVPASATGAHIVSTVAVLVTTKEDGIPFYVPANEIFKLDCVDEDEIFAKSLT